MLWVYALRPMTQLAVVPSLSNTRSLGENLGPRTHLSKRDPGPALASVTCPGDAVGLCTEADAQN